MKDEQKNLNGAQALAASPECYYDKYPDRLADKLTELLLPSQNRGACSPRQIRRYFQCLGYSGEWIENHVEPHLHKEDPICNP